MLRHFHLTEPQLARDFKEGTLKNLAVRHTGEEGKNCGLYAACDILSDTVVWIESGERHVTAAELAILSPQEREWVQFIGFEIAPGVLSVPQKSSPEELASNAGFFFNHSCDPNTMFCKVALPDGKVVYGQYTVRPILTGEEATFSYHTTETGVDEKTAFDCTCGTSDCVGHYSTTNHLQQKLALEKLALKHGPYGVMLHVLDSVLEKYPEAKIGKNLEAPLKSAGAG